MSKGSELVLSYGDKPNVELLEMYGFVVPRNPFDRIEIEIGGRAPMWKRELLNSIKLPLVVSVSWRGASPCGVARFLSDDFDLTFSRFLFFANVLSF